MSKPVTVCLLMLCGFLFCNHAWAQGTIRVLNFQADSGFRHESRDDALAMVEGLGKKNGWQVQTTREADVLNDETLKQFDVVLFNNNCGTDKRFLSGPQQKALQTYIKNGGGFVGIHCAGAIWHEGGEFQKWYEKLIGTKLVSHPDVQQATLIVEDHANPITAHLPKKWVIKDEWHKFSYNPRDKVNVLISLDESTYDGDDSVKMGGDHPFTWYQYYDGGRSFFTSLGHTKEVYADANYQRLVEGGITWASGTTIPDSVPVKNGLVLDLDADHGVEADDQGHVIRWTNQVTHFAAKDFVPNDFGMRLQALGSGRPVWGKTQANGHRAIEFSEDELINSHDDAFDHLLTGSGYTWVAVLKPFETASTNEKTEFGQHRLKDVNAFLGNLKNSGNYEGLWACLNDDLSLWCGSRSGVTFGRFDENNPKVESSKKLTTDRFHCLAGRMDSGTGTVDVEVFINNAKPLNSVAYPVSEKTNAERMAIGTERDATNHPGTESFDGAIARVLIYERPLSDSELDATMSWLKAHYAIEHNQP